MKSVRNSLVAVLAGTSVLLVPAVAQAAVPPVQPNVSASVSDTDAAQQLSPLDRKFLREGHQGNLAGVAAGRLAVRKGRCEAVRQLGATIVKEYSLGNRELRAVASRLNVRLPARPSAAQQRQLAQLTKLSGRAFDRAWLRLQISGHGEALKLVEQELRLGRLPAVKELARKANPVIERHLRLLRDAQRSC